MASNRRHRQVALASIAAALAFSSPLVQVPAAPRGDAGGVPVLFDSAFVTPARFSPNSDGNLDSVAVFYTQPETTDVLVMVCLSSRGPNSGKLLRYASRLAGKLNRNWYAVYVQTQSEEATVIDAQTQRLISDTLTLAKQLGAMVFTYKGEDIADTILRFAEEYRVGHIVIGRPGYKPLWKRFGKNRDIVTRLIENARGTTIIVLDTRPEEPLPTQASPELPEVAVPPAPSQEPATAPPEPLLLTRLRYAVRSLESERC